MMWRYGRSRAGAELATILLVAIVVITGSEVASGDTVVGEVTLSWSDPDTDGDVDDTRPFAPCDDATSASPGSSVFFAVSLARDRFECVDASARLVTGAIPRAPPVLSRSVPAFLALLTSRRVSCSSLLRCSIHDCRGKSPATIPRREVRRPRTR
jgi:hypothetical protein